MEGVGLLFILVIFGVPLLLLSLAISYYLHRRGLAKSRNEPGRKFPEDMPLFSRETFRLILLDPDAFFRSVTACRTSLFRPFILIVIGGVVYTTGYLFMTVPAMFSGGIVTILFMSSAMLPLMVIVALGGWAILAGILHLVSGFFRGTGPFVTTLQNTGYGIALYLGVSGTILAVCSVILELIRLVPGYTVLGYPPYQQPVMILITAVTLCTFPWAAWYWCYGLVHARKISFSDAINAVYGVVVVYLLVTGLPPFMAYFGNG